MSDPIESSEEEIQKALDNGWADKPDFRGDPDTWKTAEEFNKVGEDIKAVQQERNDKLLTKIRDLEGANKENAKKHEALMKYVKGSEKRQYDKAREDILKEQRVAAANGDMDRYDDLEKDRKLLEDDLEKKVEDDRVSGAREDEPNPAFAEWKKGNSWYYGGGQNEYELTTEAENYANYRLKSGAVPDLDFFNEVTAHVKAKYPSYFENPKKASPNAVGSGTQPGPSGRPKKKDFKGLPEEAKSAYYSSIKKQFNVSEEDYAKSYWEEEE